MVLVMLMSRNKKVMGQFGRTSRTLQAVGWLATAVMAAGAVMIFATCKS
jgi:hypothetical protein